jgi:hypothetical protein
MSVTGAVDLLKQHSGIVAPEAVRGIAPEKTQGGGDSFSFPTIGCPGAPPSASRLITTYYRTAYEFH